MDIVTEIDRLQAWIADLMPAAVSGDVQAALTVLDILDEVFDLLDL